MIAAVGTAVVVFAICHNLLFNLGGFSTSGDVALEAQDVALTQAHLDRIADVDGAVHAFLQVDADGLDHADRTLLQTMAEKFGGGPVGLSTLAVALGEDPGTLEEVYEPYLIQQGLIQRTPRGRVLSPRGRRTLGLPELPGEPQLFD